MTRTTRKTTPAGEPCKETGKTENCRDTENTTHPAEAPVPDPRNTRRPTEAAAPQNRQKHSDDAPLPDDDALDELRQKTIRRLTRLIQEEDNVERLAKLLKILCDIRPDDAPAPTTAPTLIEKLQNISRQQQNQQSI
ncbi:MAG: hypothetical protein J1E02_05865 [Coprobacter sp.]|nr:hypothetical protein [Coprobacter sp.]